MTRPVLAEDSTKPGEKDMLVIQYLLNVMAPGRLSDSQRGATLIEYVLIVAVIALAVFAVSQTGLVDAITGIFQDARECIKGNDC